MSELLRPKSYLPSTMRQKINGLPRSHFHYDTEREYEEVNNDLLENPKIELFNIHILDTDDIMAT